MSETKKTYKTTILIVDDKPANIVVLESLLATDERLLLHATSGEEALKITFNTSVDLVILDVQMPGMDGFEVAQVLKSNKRTKNIPIIFATAESKERQMMMKGYDEGAIDYLFKPLDPEIVKAKVTVLLKIQLQQKELVEKNLALQKSALLINNSADIIGIIDTPSFNIEDINPAFTTILGYPIEEVEQKPLISFLSEEDRSRLQVIQNQPGENHSFDMRISCKDGTIKWLQWKVVVKGSKWFVNARDITEIKLVERIRTYLATVVKQSDDAIYIYDEEGKIITWNIGAEKIYDYTETEALLMKIWNIVPVTAKAETEKLLNDVLKGKRIEHWETKRIDKHGKLIDVLFSAALITDADAYGKSIVITERDVTAQKLADKKIWQLNTDLAANVQQLKESNKDLESFSYSISHDLRAPLRRINFYANLLLQHHVASTNNEATKMLSSVQQNVTNMEVLINDLLEFSKLGRQQIKKVEIDMQAMVENVVADIIRTAAHKAVITIKPIPHAYGDPSLLIQVWINLISNAIKYSGKKNDPQIEIGVTDSESGFTYYVKDNGSGFNMKYAEKLFNVFQRLHSATDFEGTGVGLAIVHRIISKHGGSVWAEAVEEEGATFFFTIPGISESN